MTESRAMKERASGHCGAVIGMRSMKMTNFSSRTFENNYILAILEHYQAELSTGKPEPWVTDKYAVELTAFMNGQIVQAVKRSQP